MAYKTFAAIDVGSYELAMKIYEISTKNGIKEIDHIRHRIELGTDSYFTGKLGNDRGDELCRMLGEFKDIMKSNIPSKNKYLHVTDTASARGAGGIFIIQPFDKNVQVISPIL